MKGYGHWKLKFVFVLFYIWLFCWLAGYVFLYFVFHRSDKTNLSSVMERVFCYGYNGFDENVYHVARR